jgi:diaminohydroxyphosphoribosylaminopyrimidine deaminase / 5-amino-6-(5-phosphoribosylamino)uracil reductase
VVVWVSAGDQADSEVAPDLSQQEREALDVAFMQAASPESPKGPNPRVGAVILSDGQIVGVGHHRGRGTDHAEVMALAAAGEAARGGTAVVTLEPCNHVGATGPCTQALVAAGISRVVFGIGDSNPLAAGGADVLRAHGIDVIADVAVDQGLALNFPWHTAMARQRPFVTVKLAMTLDGRVAAADGTSRWITSEDARRDVHALRRDSQAIVVGTGTVLADDPQLTVRDIECAVPPLRVVVGRRPIPPAARIHDGQAPTRTFATHDPHEVLRDLWEDGVVHVLVESGPQLATEWIKAQVVDELVTYVAPALMGDGPPAFGSLGVSTIDDAIRWELVDVRRIGPDVRLTSRKPGRVSTESIDRRG